MYSSHLVEDKALLASNKEELVLWLKRKMKASRRKKFKRPFGQMKDIVKIMMT